MLWYLNSISKYFISKLITLLYLHIKVIGYLRKQRAKKLIYLFPYGTPACEIQFKILKVSSTNPEIQFYVKTSYLNNLDKKYLKKNFLIKNKDISFNSFNELINYLKLYVSNDPILARGIIDEFTRICPVKIFMGEFKVSSEFLFRADYIIKEAKKILEKADAIVIPDSAYLFNSALIYESRKNLKSCWNLNPDRVWFHYSDYKYNMLNIDYFVTEYNNNPLPHEFNSVKEYIEDRYNRKTKNRSYDKNAFLGKQSLPMSLKNKKVLFLHAFRDANLLPIDTVNPNSIFDTYYEWADYSLSLIAKNPSGWIIRPHPAAANYEGDADIFEYLIKKYDLRSIVSSEKISVTSILEQGLPVYTHSGTIALETAAFGYPSFVCSNRFPESLVKIAKSKQQWFEFMTMELEDILKLRLNHYDTRLAQYLLYKIFNQRQILFAPKYGQPNTDSDLTYLLSIFKQQWSLFLELFKTSTQKNLKEVHNQMYLRIFQH